MKRQLASIAAVMLVGIGSAAAADLGPVPIRKAPVAAPALVNNWTGFYVGAHVGYGWGHMTTDRDFGGFPASSLSPNGRGVIGGGQLGFNYQMGAILVGVETDLSGSDIKGTDSRGSALVFTTEQKIGWFGTTRARVGVLPTGNVLLYATGGLAYGETNAIHVFQPSNPALFGITFSCGTGSVSGAVSTLSSFPP